MVLLDLPRIPEPEAMDDSAEVEAYASAAEQTHLDAIDDTFVEHAIGLLGARPRGRALDIGTGPGQIVIKLARQLTLWKFTGVDRSQAMIAQASRNLAAVGDTLVGRVEFQAADGTCLPFPNGSFDFVMCNSVLHHLAEPQKLLGAMARLAKPEGAILLRDLRRPGRLAYPLHVWRHGRHYSGTMRKLFRDSVRSAYTVDELRKLVDGSPLRGVRVFAHGSTHIGIERGWML
ncbi:MAG TPA: class I SAM-dependent methyltransferase [Candidatus Acidoferrales bacterium]|nr:class I SAM-dependent methyltransferase [Candidatus Acidoferrales bacterium]